MGEFKAWWSAGPGGVECRARGSAGSGRVEGLGKIQAKATNGSWQSEHKAQESLELKIEDLCLWTGYSPVISVPLHLLNEKGWEHQHVQQGCWGDGEEEEEEQAAYKSMAISQNRTRERTRGRKADCKRRNGLPESLLTNCCKRSRHAWAGQESWRLRTPRQEALWADRGESIPSEEEPITLHIARLLLQGCRLHRVPPGHGHSSFHTWSPRSLWIQWSFR